MARVRTQEKKEKNIHSKKKARNRRRKLYDLSKMDCSCCEVKSKAKNIPRKPPQFKDLPEEVLLEIASYFSLKDLTSFGQVSRYYNAIVKNAATTWSKVSFQNVWPSRKNLKLIEKAAECGNIECLAKMSFVSLYVYNFKPGMRKCMRTSLENAEKSLKHFSKIDQLISTHIPLTWMFVRPPWAYPGGERKSLKECLLLKLEEMCKTEEATIPNLHNVGKIYSLKEDDPSDKCLTFFKNAAKKGCVNSKYELYRQQIKAHSCDDAGVALELQRTLTEIATQGHIQAQIDLCRKYADGQLGNVTQKTATDFVRKVMKSCKPSEIHKIGHYGSTKINESMRCILINWMHEVCDVKNINSEALHMAIDCLDRYLLKRSVHRKQLQLTGISCVVLASKAFSFTSSNLLTIRESAWLTDSTYDYNEVVKMLAEVIGALGGKLVRMNTSHYAEILCAFAQFGKYDTHFTHYAVDASLQFCDFGRFKPSLIAASATLLTNIIAKHGEIWPKKMAEFTGFEVKDLANCATLIHSKCLLDHSVVTDGEHRISGARDRYSNQEFLEVSKRNIPDLTTIRASIEDVEPRLRCTQTDGILHFSFKEERNVLDPSNNISGNSSFLFGYDGDEEDNLEQNHTHEDLSFLTGKEQSVLQPEAEVTSEGLDDGKHFILDYGSDSDETRLGTNNCRCKPKGLALDGVSNIEASMEKLSEAFSTACSCSSSNKSTSPEKDGPDASEVVAVKQEGGSVHGKDTRKKIGHHTKIVKNEPSMNLRSASRTSSKQSQTAPRKVEQSEASAVDENSDRDRRKRPANWPIDAQPELAATLRPRLERKIKRKPWRY